MALGAVIFDLDGTLTDSMPDLASARKAIGLVSDRPVLEAIADMPADKRARAEAILDKFEWASARAARPMDGAEELVRLLASAGIRTAVLTRSHRERAEFILERCGIKIDLVIGRGDALPKPTPDGVNKALAHFGVRPADALVVGDYRFDIEAGQAAGVPTIAITGGQPIPWANIATYQANTLKDCTTIIRRLIG